MDRDRVLHIIGERIKSIRIAKKLEQQELASLCDFEKSTMSRIESGGSNFTIGTLLKIAQALDVSLSDLVNIGTEG